MRAIILREYFILKHNIPSFICVFSLVPMMVYFFISIPLSFYINLDSGINYLHWSSIGNWVCTSSIITYLISMGLMSKYRFQESSSRAYLYSYHSNFQYLIAIVIWSSFMGFVQLIFSLIITLSLNSGNLFILDIFLIIFYVLPVIIFMAMIGSFIGILIKNNLSQRIIGLALFMCMSFSSGLFIPLSSNVPDIFLFSPLYLCILNIQAIMSNDSSMIFTSMIVFLISILLFLINLVLSHKLLRS